MRVCRALIDVEIERDAFELGQGRLDGAQEGMVDSHTGLLAEFDGRDAASFGDELRQAPFDCQVALRLREGGTWRGAERRDDLIFFGAQRRRQERFEMGGAGEMLMVVCVDCISVGRYRRTEKRTAENGSQERPK